MAEVKTIFSVNTVRDMMDVKPAYVRLNGFMKGEDVPMTKDELIALKEIIVNATNDLVMRIDLKTCD